MAQIDDLNAAIAKLMADVATLLSRVGTPSPLALDLAPSIAAVGSINTTVEAALNPLPLPIPTFSVGVFQQVPRIV